MNRIKRTIILVVASLFLISGCMTVVASSLSEESCEHYSLTFYDKTETYREFLYTHTEQHGTMTVTCNVYKVYYVVRYICDDCGTIATSTTVTEEVHVN